MGGTPLVPKRRFKFFDMWSNHGDYKTVVQDSWSSSLYGTAQFQLCKRLKGLKHPLRSLNQLHYSHISTRAEEARRLVETTQEALHQHPDDLPLQAQARDLRRKAWLLCDAERKFLYQKAKCRYFLQSDQNTKLFHSIIKRNAKRNVIPVLIKKDGQLTNGMDEVVCQFLTYYQGLLGSEVEVEGLDMEIFANGLYVPLDCLEELVRIPTDVEIKNALFGIGKDKAPGPDGYTFGFFKTSWGIVGVNVCKAVREFFTSGCLLRQLNHTIIALIPKSSNASRMGDYRPIAL